MRTIVNLVDDFRPGGIRSLLDDIARAAVWPDMLWQVQIVNSSRPIKLECKPDVIVVHYSMAWRKLPALRLLKLRYPDAKLVLVEHHYTRSFVQHNVPSHPRFRLLLRCAYGMADQVIAVSNSQANWLRSLQIMRPGQLLTIPSCRDYSRFLAIPRIDRQRQRLVIGALGRLVQIKGFDLLIEAMRALPGDRYLLRIAGDGEEMGNLQKQAEGLDNVEFVGQTDDPAAFLADCDIFAMPSRMESFGLVCAEAKAAGLPVVVSNVDALPDQARGCGVVVEPDDVAALVAGIRALDMPHKLRRFRERARTSIVNNWSDYLSAWTAVLH